MKRLLAPLPLAALAACTHAQGGGNAVISTTVTPMPYHVAGQFGQHSVAAPAQYGAALALGPTRTPTWHVTLRPPDAPFPNERDVQGRFVFVTDDGVAVIDPASGRVSERSVGVNPRRNTHVPNNYVSLAQNQILGAAGETLTAYDVDGRKLWERNPCSRSAIAAIRASETMVAVVCAPLTTSERAQQLLIYTTDTGQFRYQPQLPGPFSTAIEAVARDLFAVSAPFSGALSGTNDTLVDGRRGRTLGPWVDSYVVAVRGDRVFISDRKPFGTSSELYLPVRMRTERPASTGFAETIAFYAPDPLIGSNNTLLNSQMTPYPATPWLYVSAEDQHERYRLFRYRLAKSPDKQSPEKLLEHLEISPRFVGDAALVMSESPSGASELLVLAPLSGKPYLYPIRQSFSKSTTMPATDPHDRFVGVPEGAFTGIVDVDALRETMRLNVKCLSARVLEAGARAALMCESPTQPSTLDIYGIPK